jgi:hypothetical protein
VYIGHLLAENQTSWVGTILLLFSVIVTIVVAIYLYKSFQNFKRRQNHVAIVSLEEGETEFEIAAPPKGKFREHDGTIRASEDNFLFDDEEEEV